MSPTHILLFVTAFLLLTPHRRAETSCAATNTEDRVLCAASQAQDLSAAQVLAEDATADLPAAPPSADTAQDVWTNAYKQWVNRPSAASALGSSVDKALRAARKRLGAAAAPSGDERESVLDLASEDDELAVVTRAAKALATGARGDAVRDAVATIEALCGSGDNGRQVAAAGGMGHLLRLAATAEEDVAVLAVKAVATCAQNNPPVMERAVAAGGVAKLLEKAGRGVVGMRAAALRALVAVAENAEAQRELAEKRAEVARVLGEAVVMREGREEKRCVVRGFALAEAVLRAEGWREVMAEVGGVAKGCVEDEDVDVREAAGRVLALLK